MIALQTAIQSAFNGSSGLMTAFPSGLWLDLPPAGTSMPYVVLTTIASPRTTTYASAWSEPRVQFAAFGEDHDGTGAGMDALTAVFDDAILGLTTGQMFDALRLDEPTDAAMPPEADGRTVWRWLTTYKFAIRS